MTDSTPNEQSASPQSEGFAWEATGYVDALEAIVAAQESLLASLSRSPDVPRDWLREDAEKVQAARAAVNALKADT